ncbi:MAG: transporter [Deltaproteobacteria bacterium]|nr:transporter [Deltaproteobacteria bacterium]
MMQPSLGKTIWLILATVLVFQWSLISSPAAAQGPAALMAKPAPAAEQKEETPSTCGPLISDTCNPIETHKLSMQVLFGYEFDIGNVTNNWRKVSAKGDFPTFFTNLKIIYGPTKNLETYVIIPYIHNWANNLDRSIAGPNGERNANYGGIGDITMVGKYLLLPETDYRPAVAGVAGLTVPTGHASRLNPRFLIADSVGTGAFTFITGVNLFKYLKPFLVHSQIWMNTPVNVYEQTPRNVRSREYVTFNVAVEYPITKRWIALFEFFSNWTWTNLAPQNISFTTPQTLIGVLPGIEFVINDKWACAAGASIELFGKNGNYEYTPMLTVYRNF